MKGKTGPEKSIYTREYAVVLRLLRQAREKAGLTQVDLAKRLGQTQSFVSKIECGDRRLDIVQLRKVLLILGQSLPDFATAMERDLRQPE